MSKMVQRERSTATEEEFFTGLNSIDKMDEEVQLASKELNELKEGAALAVIYGFDPMKKKKKKKHKDRVREDLNNEPIENEAEHLEILSPPSSIGNGLDSSFPSLKMKRNEHADCELEEGNLDPTSETNGGKVTKKEEDNVADAIVLESRFPWEGLDRDYKYEELLGMVLNILRENNPELAGEKRRTIMRPPQVLREGTKKTVFVNFIDLCKTMHRQPEHATAFLLAELGTSGSLDGQQRLVVRGRFAPKNFEGILRRYVNEYVMCNWCKSSDTILTKENRLLFLHCEQCGSSRSVAQIKAGFVAKVGRRKAAT